MALVDKYEELIDGKKYVVEFFSPSIFNPCWLAYHVYLYEVINGSKKLVLKTEANSHNMKPNCFIKAAREEEHRLIRISS